LLFFRQTRWLSMPALALGITVVTAAPAQTPSEQAEQLFREGRESIGRGDYAAACPKFAESVRLTRRPGPLLNLAQCEEHQGKLMSALTHWREGIALLPPGDERIAVSTERAATLEQKIPRLTVKLGPAAPAGSKVTLDGADLKPAAIGAAVTLDPGEHVIVVSAPGHMEARSTISLTRGERREITMTPGSEQPQQADPPSTPDPPVSPPSPGRGAGWTAGFVVGGLGLAALAAGGVTGILTIQKKADKEEACPNYRCPTDKRFSAGEDARKAGALFSTISTVTFAVGGAAVVAGIILIATSASKAPRVSTTVEVTALPGGAAFTLQGRF
jgi:hypothetical protein